MLSAALKKAAASPAETPSQVPVDEREYTVSQRKAPGNEVEQPTALSSSFHAASLLSRTSLLSLGGRLPPLPSKSSDLTGKVVVFVSAGYSGKRFVFEKAQALGVRAIVVDGSDAWSKSLVADGLAERFIGCDMSDTENVQPFILSALQSLASEAVHLDGICTFSEVAVPLVSRLAEALGLPGNPVGAVDTARDKHATRAKMAAAGLATPKNVLLLPGAGAGEVAAAGVAVGFPAVLKPTGGAASIGVLRVDSPQALAAGHSRVVAELARSVIDSSGTVVQLTPGDALPPGARHLESPLILEEYLDGTEIDCDVILDHGVAVYAQITDNWQTVEPWFNETGDNAPSLLSAAQQAEMRSLCVDTLSALGFTTGTFHVEGKVTSRGARLIEVNCRMGGGQIRDNNLAVWGVDLVTEHIVTAVGLPCKARAADPNLTCRSALSIVAPITGVMGPGDWFAPVRDWEGVVYARLFAKEGDRVVCAADGMPTWCGQVMCDGKTVEEAIARVRKVEAAVKPPIIAG